MEYGDRSDFMGDGEIGVSDNWRSPVELNPPHREFAGWLATDDTLRVEACGIHHLPALALAPDVAELPRVLEIERSATGDLVYLSWRAAIGFDAAMDPDFVDRLEIQRCSTGRCSATDLLAMLAPGEQFVDDGNDLRVRVLGRGDQSAEVEILLDPALHQTIATVDPERQPGNLDLLRHRGRRRRPPVGTQQRDRGHDQVTLPGANPALVAGDRRRRERSQR